LLLTINYNQPDFFIGELDNLISLESEKRDEQIRQPEDYVIDMTRLMEKIELYNDKVDNIEFITDSRMRFKNKDEVIKLEELEKFMDKSSEVL